MTDSEKKFVNFDEFASYLERVNALYTCPMCSHRKWSLSTPDTSLRNGEKANIIPTLPGTDLQSNGGVFLHSKTHNLLIMECESCGYMSFFNHNTVLEKIKNNEFAIKEGSKEENEE